MNPVDVPDTIVSDFARNFWGLSLAQLEPGSRDLARQALGSVLPRLESLVRAHIAGEAKETMTPAAVPAGLVDIGVMVFEDQAHENCGDDPCPGNTRPYHETLMREALAEILPEYGNQVREQVAKEAQAAAAPTGEQPRDTEDRLYGKYYVRRADGREKPGADYFVLNLASDREAQTAALAFADVCEDTRPGLAGDLRARIAAYRTPTTRTETA